MYWITLVHHIKGISGVDIQLDTHGYHRILHGLLTMDTSGSHAYIILMSCGFVGIPLDIFGGYLFLISYLNDLQNCQKISLDILRYPLIS
jgi:hypothetical protein